MDPFEEFEFKPLTDGLGFHKKTVKLNDQVRKSGLVEDQLGKSVPGTPPDNMLEDRPAAQPQTYEDLLAALEPTMKPVEPPRARAEASRSQVTEVAITEPLPRDKQKASAIEIEPPMMPPAPMPPIERERPRSQPQRPEVSTPRSQPGTRRGAADSPVGGLVAASVSIRSAVLDFIVVFALALVFLVSLLAVTKVDLLSVVFNAQNDLTTQLSMGLLFLAVLQMYVVVSRSFFGRTLGEWTFDYQMGNDDQHKSGVYPLKVVWRSLIVIGTGLVLLPVLSLLFNRDLAAKLTGLQLYRQRV